ncbi:hypothetical protein RSAG8_13456, partial [Rhizoctonia solani AG-8 WAC10335]
VSEDDQIRKFREQFLPAEGLTMSTFQRYWSSLVYAEEFQTDMDLQEFDMYDVQLQKTGRTYQLAVPGIAENKPLVLKGDRIKIYPHSKPENVSYRGTVRAIEGTTVLISVYGKFPYDSAGLYDVQFTLNPIQFQRMIQALNVKEKRSNVLFPRVEDMEGMSKVAQSAEEQEIVTRLPPGSPPFIIFGPPGTGKTVTIVECISQLLDNDQVRVLACAPSNPASDVIAQRLIDLRGLQPAQLLRLNDRGRAHEELPEDLIRYSVREDDQFAVPSLEKLNSFKVIIATCSSASLLFGQGVDPGAFTHIFV